MASHMYLVVVKNMTVSLISGIMEFQSQDITKESSSSHAPNAGSLSFGPVPNRWPSFPFPLRKVLINCDHFR